MKFACYTCGYKLGEGLPPIEALSKEQREQVDGKTNEIWHNVLDGTRFEGMSTYSFCEFCLLMMQVDKLAFDRRMEREVDMLLGIALHEDEHPEDEWTLRTLSDHVLLNRTLLINEIDMHTVDDDLIRLYLNHRNDVRERQLAAIKRIKEREAYKRTLRYKLRNQWFRLRRTLSLPYHLNMGLHILWETITMPKSWDIDEQADVYEDMAEVSYSWHLENHPDAPFAKFELWARGQYSKRFHKLYN